MLLLSAALHAAVIAIVQPRAFPPVADEVVLTARLQAETAAPPSRQAQRSAAPPAAPVPASVTRALGQAVPVMPAPDSPPAATQPVRAESPSQVSPAPPAPAPSPASVGPPRQAASLPEVPVMVDSNWYEARQLDAPPEVVSGGVPIYPSGAWRRGVEGTVRLKLLIDEFGVVRELEVAAGNPPGVFDESALAAYRTARFRPGRKDGRPVRTQVYVPVRYMLKD